MSKLRATSGGRQMRLQGREISPTRASQLALRDEQKLIHEGYEFLDEKRMLLAQELLRQLGVYRTLNARNTDARLTARDSLTAAAMHHGLEELSIYLPPLGSPQKVQMKQRNYMGLTLVEAVLIPEVPTVDEDAPGAAFPSSEAPKCARAFRDLMAIDVARAAICANLHRLVREYIATERRARALENVLLPEITLAVKQIGEHLDASEQEEALLVRHVKSRHVKDSKVSP